MIFRRLAPVVLVAFFAAQVAACACTASLAGPAKKESHSCCAKKTAPSPKAPPGKACCCSDGTHVAVAGDPAPVAEVPTGIAVAVVLRIVATGERHPAEFDRPPPGRAPDIPLYTLYSSLLI